MSEFTHQTTWRTAPRDSDSSLNAASQAKFAPPVEPRRKPEVAHPLSPREREVAMLMASGYTNREIADALFIAIATAERHATNIFNKLGVRSRTRVAVWAVETGLALGRAG